MPRPKVIVLALGPLQEPGDPVALPQRGKGVVAAGEELPGIGLVAHVPDDPVGRRVELVQQRDAEFDHAEAGADVAAGHGDALDETVADLLRELRELLALQPLQVGRTVDRRQQCHDRSELMGFLMNSL